MAHVKAEINKETLNFICSQMEVSVAYLSKKTGQTKEKISAWMDPSSDGLPTIIQAKKLAKALNIPFAGLYMNKNHVPINKIPFLKNLRTLPYAIEIDDSSLNLAITQLIRYHNFLISSGSEMKIETTPVSLPAISQNISVVELAKTIRVFFDIDLDIQYRLRSSRQFYLYLRRKIEDKGIFVHCFAGVDIENARGISIFNDTFPIIGINEKDRYPAKIFSIIHEIVHILKHQSAICNDMATSSSSRQEEVFCNAVAGETLVPANSLAIHLETRESSSISLDDIDALSKKFYISKEVIIRRLLDTKRFTQKEYLSFADEMKQDFLQQQEGQQTKSFSRNISREAIDKTSPSISHILLMGYSDGYFSKQDVSGLLGIKEKHIPQFFMEVVKCQVSMQSK